MSSVGPKLLELVL